MNEMRGAKRQGEIDAKRVRGRERKGMRTDRRLR